MTPTHDVYGPAAVLSSRRAVLADMGMGFTGLALGAMLFRDGVRRADANEVAQWLPPTGQPHFAPRAKSVIWIFLVGGMSQMESFDPKPALNEHAGKEIAETPFKDALSAKYLKNLRIHIEGDANGHIRQKLYPLQAGYRKRGARRLDAFLSKATSL